MDESQKHLPVVGIGASAGGLEAIREFFSGDAGAGGMAFVVVQHLDPTHESLMAQLIEKYTPMAVRQAEGGEKLLPDHVYVIPPGSGLAIDDGILNLTEFADPRGMRRPIDDFLESLAQQSKEYAGCVILSGTGADGSRGLRAIKEEGGIAIAQEPDSARYDGMPTAAIGTGCIDVVCSPRDMMTELQSFFDRSLNKTATRAEADEVVDHIDELCEVLQDAVGHDFSNYKRATLSRRIARRMQVLDIAEAGNYLRRIKGDSDECEALFRDLLINVTKFFRDKTEFEALREQVIEPLVRNSRDSQEMRVWIAGCSSGEEAYSIAMMFADVIKQSGIRPYLQIFATDIDDKMLDIARNATYSLSALSDIPNQYRNDYVIGSSDTFTIAPQIRDMVRFSLHNLMRDPPFSKVDLVSCRNLLIYFDDVLQKQVMPLFHFALRPETGYLFLGSSEAIGKYEDLFETLELSARIFKRKNVKSRYNLKMPTGRNKPNDRPQTLTQAGPDLPRRNPIELAALNRIASTYAPVTLLTDEEGVLLERWGKAGKFLEFPDRLERNVHVPTLARPGLRELIGPMLREVRSTGRRQIARDVKVETEFGIVPTGVICESLGDNGYIFIFRESGPLEAFEDDGLSEFDREDGQLQFLEDELQNTRHRLRSTVEELETTNEELKSSNEEMMSMNEELQSTNEELTTVNDELKIKVDQITTANSDLRNFFDSTELVVLVVNPDLTIRSFTEAAHEIFEINNSDVGNPLAQIQTQLADKQYVKLAEAAARSGKADEYRTSSLAGDDELIVKVIPYRDLDGSVNGATLVFTDVTQVLTLERDLRQERERLRLALEVAKVGIWEYEPATDKTMLDATERYLLGLKDDEGDTMEPILARLPGEDRDRINSALRMAMDGEKDFDETFRIELPDGGFRWLHGLGRRIEADGTRKFIGVTFDVSAEREILGSRDVMIREMNHRVKNLFAVIAAMISISAKDSDDVTAFADDLRSRIHALGRSHSLTNSDRDDSPTTLNMLIETVVRPTKSTQLVKVSGDAVEIDQSQITSLALILHEWATNSSKYGALSVGDGELAIMVARSDGEVTIDWQETGQTDAAETGAGFGTRLVDVTARQLRGSVSGDKTDGGYTRQLTFELTA